MHRQRDSLGLLAWRDRKIVYVLANHVRIDKTVIAKRLGREHKRVDTTIPQVIDDYNHHRGGVDTVDQMRGTYYIGRRSRKWWPRLAWWIIDICIVNAYTYFQKQTGSKMTQLEFRLQLIAALESAHPIQIRQIEAHSEHVRGRPAVAHWPAHSEKKLDCVQCSRRPDHRVRTSIICDHCRKHLCAVPCFKVYHTQ